MRRRGSEDKGERQRVQERKRKTRDGTQRSRRWRERGERADGDG